MDPVFCGGCFVLPLERIISECRQLNEAGAPLAVPHRVWGFTTVVLILALYVPSMGLTDLTVAGTLAGAKPIPEMNGQGEECWLGHATDLVLLLRPADNRPSERVDLVRFLLPGENQRFPFLSQTRDKTVNGHVREKKAGAEGIGVTKPICRALVKAGTRERERVSVSNNPVYGSSQVPGSAPADDRAEQSGKMMARPSTG